MKRLLLAMTSLLLAATPPQPTRVAMTAQDYPEAAREAGVEGDVAFDLLIDAKGKITGCEVTAGADLPAGLATGTCAVAVARWRFAPARDDAGTKVAGRTSHAIAWRIARRCPPPDGKTVCVFL